jgi:hypothetical protein
MKHIFLLLTLIMFSTSSMAMMVCTKQPDCEDCPTTCIDADTGE